MGCSSVGAKCHLWPTYRGNAAAISPFPLPLHPPSAPVRRGLGGRQLFWGRRSVNIRHGGAAHTLRALISAANHVPVCDQQQRHFRGRSENSPISRQGPLEGLLEPKGASVHRKKCRRHRGPDRREPFDPSHVNSIRSGALWSRVRSVSGEGRANVPLRPARPAPHFTAAVIRYTTTSALVPLRVRFACNEGISASGSK